MGGALITICDHIRVVTELIACAEAHLGALLSVVVAAQLQHALGRLRAIASRLCTGLVAIEPFSTKNVIASTFRCVIAQAGCTLFSAARSLFRGRGGLPRAFVTIRYNVRITAVLRTCASIHFRAPKTIRAAAQFPRALG